MRVRYTPQARNDLAAIYRYLDQRSPAGAQSVKATIERRIRLLEEFPFIAPLTEEAGVYELSIVRYPYKVYYRVEGDEVRIVHVRHTSRERPEPKEF
jgi:plasmid stabilization system protein ParE